MNTKFVIFLVLSSFYVMHLGAFSKINSYSNGEECFQKFLERFYSDSVFQKNRIKTPLKGYIKYWYDDEEIVLTDNWSISDLGFISSYNKLKESNSRLKHDIREQEGLRVETIFIEQSGFKIQRTYQIINSKWYLIEYIWIDL